MTGRRTLNLVSLNTELLRPGGVQRLAGHMVAVQSSYAVKNGLTHEVLSLNDPGGFHCFDVAGRTVRVEGFGGHRLRMVSRAWKLARSAAFVAASHTYLAPICMIMRTRAPGLRCTTHVHGIEVWSPMTYMRQTALADAWMVTATSTFSAAKLREVQRRVPQRIQVLYPTLDPSFLHHVKDPKSPPELEGLFSAPFILTVARLDVKDRQKGIDTSIRAFAQINDAHPTVRYAIIGDGSDRPRLEKLAKELGVADRVVFLGRQPDEVLSLCYRRCELFLLPSAKEGFGIVFLEAMACEKPVVGGDTGGTPEIIRDGESGYLVPFDDPHLQAEKLHKLLCDKVLRVRLGQAGKRRLEEEFSFRSFEERYLAVLHEGCVQEVESKLPIGSTAHAGSQN